MNDVGWDYDFLEIFIGTFTISNHLHFTPNLLPILNIDLTDKTKKQTCEESEKRKGGEKRSEAKKSQKKAGAGARKIEASQKNANHCVCAMFRGEYAR